MTENHDAKISTTAKAHALIKEASARSGLKMWKLTEDAVLSYTRDNYPEIYREHVEAV